VKQLILTMLLALASCGGVVGEDCMPAASGECNMVTQCGCSDGEWCTWFPDTTRCRTHETCSDLEAGSLEVGEDCSGSGRCRPGTACNPPGVLITDVCLEWCQDVEDCTEEGVACSIEATYDIAGCDEPVTLPYMLCTLAE